MSKEYNTYLMLSDQMKNNVLIIFIDGHYEIERVTIYHRSRYANDTLIIGNYGCVLEPYRGVFYALENNKLTKEQLKTVFSLLFEGTIKKGYFKVQ